MCIWTEHRVLIQRFNMRSAYTCCWYWYESLKCFGRKIGHGPVKMIFHFDRKIVCAKPHTFTCWKMWHANKVSIKLRVHTHPVWMSKNEKSMLMMIVLLEWFFVTRTHGGLKISASSLDGTYWKDKKKMETKKNEREKRAQKHIWTAKLNLHCHMHNRIWTIKLEIFDTHCDNQHILIWCVS